MGLQGLAGAEAAGLRTPEWYALSLLTREGSPTSGELATRTGLTTGATSRLVDRLERAGYAPDARPHRPPARARRTRPGRARSRGGGRGSGPPPSRRGPGPLHT
ncbi:MarR family transcriptional regulator [Streptomyces flaveolus]|uniref:MarR family winged helix-turn-helix transcriptional regulator n=1 Tax=Streptomyces flaveolus TaxID=67297 RepID=UPI0033BE4A83